MENITSINMFRYEKRTLHLVGDESVGQFFSGDTYIIFHQENVRSDEKYKNQTIAYIWHGKDAAFAKDFDIIQAITTSSFYLSLKKKKISVFIKIVQGNTTSPPTSFTTLFQNVENGFIIHGRGAGCGKYESIKCTNRPFSNNKCLYQIKKQNELLHCMEVPKACASLNGDNCFVLVMDGLSLVWIPDATTEDEREVAMKVGGVLAGDKFSVIKMMEGFEMDEFWLELGGISSYPAQGPAEETNCDPKLFSYNVRALFSKWKEIPSFQGKDDLINDFVMVLDCQSMIYVWVGMVKEMGPAKAFTIASDFLSSKLSSNYEGSASVCILYAGREPDCFKQYFPGWGSLDQEERAEIFAEDESAVQPTNTAEENNHITKEEEEKEIVYKDENIEKKVEKEIDIIDEAESNVEDEKFAVVGDETNEKENLATDELTDIAEDKVVKAKSTSDSVPISSKEQSPQSSVDDQPTQEPECLESEAEEARLLAAAMIAKKADDERLAVEAEERRAVRKLEERLAAEAKLKAEEEILEIEKKAEEERLATWAQKVEEDEKLAAEAQKEEEERLATWAQKVLEEERLAAEAQKVLEEERLAAVAQKVVEDEKLAAEAQKVVEDEKLAAEAQKEEEERLATWAQKVLEEERLAAEAQKVLEEERLAAVAQKVVEDEKLAAEAQKVAEEERLAAEARRVEEERVSAEAQKVLEEERLAAKAQKAVEEERLATWAQKVKEDEKIAAKAQKEEEKRLATWAQKVEEDEKLAAKARKEEEESLATRAQKVEEEDILAVEAIKVEMERLAAKAQKVKEERLAAEAQKVVKDSELAAKAQKVKEERLAAETQKVMEDEKLAAKAQKVEEEKKEERRLSARKEEEKRVAAEAQKKEEEERLAADAEQVCDNSKLAMLTKEDKAEDNYKVEKEENYMVIEDIFSATAISCISIEQIETETVMETKEVLEVKADGKERDSPQKEAIILKGGATSLEEENEKTKGTIILIENENDIKKRTKEELDGLKVIQEEKQEESLTEQQMFPQHDDETSEQKITTNGEKLDDKLEILMASDMSTENEVEQEKLNSTQNKKEVDIIEEEEAFDEKYVEGNQGVQKEDTIAKDTDYMEPLMLPEDVDSPPVEVLEEVYSKDGKSRQKITAFEEMIDEKVNIMKEVAVSEPIELFDDVNDVKDNQSVSHNTNENTQNMRVNIQSAHRLESQSDNVSTEEYPKTEKIPPNKDTNGGVPPYDVTTVPHPENVNSHDNNNDNNVESSINNKKNPEIDQPVAENMLIVLQEKSQKAGGNRHQEILTMTETETTNNNNNNNNNIDTERKKKKNKNKKNKKNKKNEKSNKIIVQNDEVVDTNPTENEEIEDEVTDIAQHDIQEGVPPVDTAALEENYTIKSVPISSMEQDPQSFVEEVNQPTEEPEFPGSEEAIDEAHNTDPDKNTSIDEGNKDEEEQQPEGEEQNGEKRSDRQPQTQKIEDLTQGTGNDAPPTQQITEGEEEKEIVYKDENVEKKVEKEIDIIDEAESNVEDEKVAVVGDETNEKENLATDNSTDIAENGIQDDIPSVDITTKVVEAKSTSDSVPISSKEQSPQSSVDDQPTQEPECLESEAEEARLLAAAMIAKKADDEKLAVEAEERRAVRKLEERLAAEAKLKAEEEILEIEKKAEEERLATWAQKVLEEERLAAEAQKVLEEERLAAVAQKVVEDEKLAAEAQKVVEDEKLAAEAQKVEEEERLAAEAQKVVEDEKLAAEAQKVLEEERLAAETQKVVEDEKLAAEAQKVVEDEGLAAEAQKVENYEKLSVKAAENEKLVAESKMVEEKRLAAEGQKKAKEDRIAAKAQTKAEEMKLAMKGDEACEESPKDASKETKSKPENKSVEPEDIIVEEKQTQDEIDEILVEKHLSLDELQKGKMQDIDLIKRESYLSPDDFSNIFGMTYVAFKCMKKWKQNVLKKKHGLF